MGQLDRLIRLEKIASSPTSEEIDDEESTQKNDNIIVLAAQK
jgi:hypothetical protein